MLKFENPGEQLFAAGPGKEHRAVLDVGGTDLQTAPLVGGRLHRDNRQHSSSHFLNGGLLIPHVPHEKDAGALALRWNPPNVMEEFVEGDAGIGRVGHDVNPRRSPDAVDIPLHFGREVGVPPFGKWPGQCRDLQYGYWSYSCLQFQKATWGARGLPAISVSSRETTFTTAESNVSWRGR